MFELLSAFVELLEILELPLELFFSVKDSRKKKPADRKQLINGASGLTDHSIAAPAAVVETWNEPPELVQLPGAISQLVSGVGREGNEIALDRTRQ